MGHVERIQEDAVVEGQAAVKYRSRGVPGDWYVDPADPEAAERYNQRAEQSLEDQATAFLAAHEAFVAGEDHEAGESYGSPLEVQPRSLEPRALEPRSFEATPQPVWIGLPVRQDFDDEGELGWQTDALCAQTDPEAFFPEKGGSTRDAKKVCGACNVRSQCLEYALSNDERFGIWGGLSERERRRLRKRAV